MSLDELQLITTDQQDPCLEMTNASLGAGECEFGVAVCKMRRSRLLS